MGSDFVSTMSEDKISFPAGDYPDFDMSWPPMQPVKSNVNHPSHYNQGDIECIDAMLASAGKEAVQSFCRLSIMKYLWRFEHKNGLEDLEKAKWYMEKLIDLSKLD
tara:strand:- start:582 stop:899 length:318 start_codon:yes stop_codon:yes gene_type:complete